MCCYLVFSNDAISNCGCLFSTQLDYVQLYFKVCFNFKLFINIIIRLWKSNKSNRSLRIFNYLIQNTSTVKKAWPSKVESYLEVKTWIDWWQQDLMSECCQGLAYWTQKLPIHIITSYHLQSLIRPANLLLAISCYKFHISKDQQENIKFTIICDLGAFFVNDSI